MTATILTDRGVNLPAHGLPVAPRKRRKDATKLTEREFMAQVVAFAKLHGWLVYHTHDSRRCAAGFPDLVLVKGLRLIFAELKVGKNKTSPEQDTWLNALNRAVPALCGAALVWRPEYWHAIKRSLSEPD